MAVGLGRVQCIGLGEEGEDPFTMLGLPHRKSDSFRLKAVGQPSFDQGLPGDAVPARHPVKLVDHPHRDVHVYPILFVARARHSVRGEIIQHVFASIKLLLKILGCRLRLVFAHKSPLHFHVPDAR